MACKSVNMNGIGILAGNRSSFIDHLVPLCAFMDIPILVTDSSIKNLIELYYPAIEVQLAQPDDFILDEALKDYDLFFYVHYYRTGNETFLFDEYFSSKRARSVMSLHGNPDKFLDIYWIEHLADEDIVLAYGPQLLELMKGKGINKQPIVCGNYRLEYYKAHEAFFDATLPFNKEKRTVLYAPTWASENRKIEHRKYFTSFFEVYKELFETIPDDFQLIVKLHPFLPTLMFSEIEKIKEDYPHIRFLDNYPLIYPLLKQVDIYLGDYSSIGYDFLFFRPPALFSQYS